MVTAPTTVGDRYDLIEHIASGGMGSVHRAHDRKLKRDVAVKLLKDDLAEDHRFIERFRREARAAAGLSHENVARVFDYGVDGGCHFIVMEFAEGRDLARLLRDENALPARRARAIARQIAAALGHAHEIGIVHRDVKPANVLVDDDDLVKVTDFGIARAAGTATLTVTGSVLGTAQYVAPEQASGQEIGPPTDVYALGIVLYEMLTGAVPFTGASAIEVAMKHVNDEVPEPSALRPEVPTDLDDIVRRATAKDPKERFADGHAMALALDGGIATPTAPLPGTRTRTAVLPLEGVEPRSMWRPAAWVLAGLLVLALLLAGYRVLSSGTEDLAPGAATQDEQEQEELPPAQEEEEPAPPPPGYVIPSGAVGMNYKDIERAVDATGLDIDVETEKIDSTEPKDQVLETRPAPGSRVEPGGTITLIVSSGKAPKADDDDDDDRGPAPGRGRGRGRDDDD